MPADTPNVWGTLTCDIASYLALRAVVHKVLNFPQKVCLPNTEVVYPAKVLSFRHVRGVCRASRAWNLGFRVEGLGFRV